MQPNPLLNTDQSRCFDADGNRIDCANSGQDGARAVIAKAPPDRFDVTENLVRDQWTHLVWPVNANVAEFPLAWQEAHDFVHQMNRSRFGGRSDWRLPARSDLFSIISHQHVNPALPGHHPFRNIFNGYYWTSTTCARLPDQAWYIHLGGARVYRGMKHGSYMVWPVAGTGTGATRSEERFVAREHTFYDRLTGRTWFNGPWLDTGPLVWRQALDWINGLNEKAVAGHRDWRLPNIRELDSLVDVGGHSPALASGCPLGETQQGYWSATTSMYETRYAWVLYPQDGAIGVGYKPQADFYPLAVR